MNRWKDVWLNEGPAIYSELLWEEREGVATVQETTEAMWAEIPAAPSAGYEGEKEES